MRTLKKVAGGWRVVFAEDEETKFRSEAAKLRVEGSLASRVESTDKSRGGDADVTRAEWSCEQLGTGGCSK